MTQVVGVQVPPPAPTLRSPQKTAPARGLLFTLLCPLPIPVLSVCPAPAPAIRVRFLSRGTSATAAIGFGILLRWIWRRRRNGYWRRQERGRGERRKRVGVLRHDGWGKAVSARCIRLAAHLRMYWAWWPVRPERKLLRKRSGVSWFSARGVYQRASLRAAVRGVKRVRDVTAAASQKA